MTAVRWRPTLTPRANDDLCEIVAWTQEHFGRAQAESYREVIFAALRELENGPDIAGAKARGEIADGLRSLHVARHGRHGRHLILFRAKPEEAVLEILRILHDRMDLVRHLPSA